MVNVISDSSSHKVEIVLTVPYTSADNPHKEAGEIGGWVLRTIKDSSVKPDYADLDAARLTRVRYKEIVV